MIYDKTSNLFDTNVLHLICTTAAGTRNTMHICILNPIIN